MSRRHRLIGVLSSVDQKEMNAPYGMLLNAVADTAYLNISTAAAASEHGERDNYTRFMRNLSTPTLQENGMLELGGLGHFGTLPLPP